MRTRWSALGHVAAGWILLGAASGCGGGDGDDDEDDTDGSGTVTAPWDAYCVATFTKDTLIEDFGEPLFTARAGESYLMTSFDAFGELIAEMAYLTAKGPYEFELRAATAAELPFTSNCAVGAGKSYYAAFTDVSVFADEGLTSSLCSLTAGTVVANNGMPAGYSSVDFGFSGPATYEVMLNGFSASCGNADRGYVSVPEARAFGVTTWLVPIVSILGPS